jgi:hypothetical protein
MDSGSSRTKERTRAELLPSALDFKGDVQRSCESNENSHEHLHAIFVA